MYQTRTVSVQLQFFGVSVGILFPKEYIIGALFQTSLWSGTNSLFLAGTVVTLALNRVLVPGFAAVTVLTGHAVPKL